MKNKKNKWVNSFHKTSAISTLTAECILKAHNQYSKGYITSTHSLYRKMKRLEDKLCPNKRSLCACSDGNYIQEA